MKQEQKSEASGDLIQALKTEKDSLDESFEHARRLLSEGRAWLTIVTMLGLLVTVTSVRLKSQTNTFIANMPNLILLGLY